MTVTVNGVPFQPSPAIVEDVERYRNAVLAAIAATARSLNIDAGVATIGFGNELVDPHAVLSAVGNVLLDLCTQLGAPVDRIFASLAIAWARDGALMLLLNAERHVVRATARGIRVKGGAS